MSAMPAIMALASLLACGLTQVQACVGQDGPNTLKLHNIFRAAHDAGSMVWDKAAQDGAKKWATKLAKNCKLVHSSLGERNYMGENLYMAMGTSSMSGSCVDATKMWYGEEDNFKYGTREWSKNKGHFGEIGHFTQMVWKDTYALGCAAAAGRGCVVVACRYQSSGNIVMDSYFDYNVCPKSKAGMARARSMANGLPQSTARQVNAAIKGRKLLRASSSQPDVQYSMSVQLWAPKASMHTEASKK